MNGFDECLKMLEGISCVGYDIVEDEELIVTLTDGSVLSVFEEWDGRVGEYLYGCTMVTLDGSCVYNKHGFIYPDFALQDLLFDVDFE